MSARTIVVPKYTSEDQSGTHFVRLTEEALGFLAREGYGNLQQSELSDGNGKVAACVVTGQKNR